MKRKKIATGEMAREVEIKLEIPASTVSKVMRLPWLWELASGELRASHMVSTYYDTKNGALRGRGITLRVRRVGGVCVQTVKAAVNGAALPIERHEWEEEVSGAGPDLARATGTALDAIPKKKLKDLRPRFDVKVDRSAFPIQSANSAIEIAIDRAQMAGDGETISFCEIELELKRGAASELARIARRIANETPASLVLKTKSDRGFALHERDVHAPHSAEPVAIDATARVGEAFQTIAWSCLRHFALNADAVISGDTRGVHQMRVGLRRLGAAISVFKHMVDGPETDAIKVELKWLTDELMQARALDVFIEETLAPMQDGKDGAEELAALRADAEARRGASMECAKAALRSDRYRRLAVRTALWIIAAEWSDRTAHAVEEPSRRVGAFAERTLSHRTRQVVRRLSHFRELDDVRRHKLRIAVKKLRYATEFFDGVFPERRHRRRNFLRALENLQDDLGQLNDIAGLEPLRREFMAAWTEPSTNAAQSVQKAFAMGLAIGQQQQKKAVLIAAVDSERRRLASLAPFWT